jgi:hypothetical protein
VITAACCTLMGGSFKDHRSQSMLTGADHRCCSVWKQWACGQWLLPLLCMALTQGESQFMDVP